LTIGIISSLNRTLPAKKKGTYTKGIIQIDAALNQGNSGGPLLDSQGLLIGMNTAIASSTGQNTGVGFSIPVNTIRRVVPELIRFGKVIRADLGIAMTFPADRGLGIAVVAPNSPAEAAGLRGIRMLLEQRRQGQFILESRRRDFDYADRILSIDAQDIHSLDDLQSFLETKKPGDRIKLHILRGGAELDVVVKLGVEE
jgi:S1-C subfamily serine protease